MSDSDVNSCQNLTTKVNPRAVRVKLYPTESLAGGGGVRWKQYVDRRKALGC